MSDFEKRTDRRKFIQAGLITGAAAMASGSIPRISHGANLKEDFGTSSLYELSRLIQNRKISCTELVQGYLDRIKKYDGQDGINAFITLNGEGAIEEAKKLDNMLKEGRYLGPLHGIPIALKDNIETKGIRTTGGTKVLKNWVPPSEGTVVSRLKVKGAIIIGKNNMHELAFGMTNNNPHYGPARNPYDKARIPGGSSGGTAAAVAAGLCAGGLGTETGSSVRMPAALCGVVGLRPTFGLVGKSGLIEIAFTRDSIGPITRTVEDTAILLQEIAGPDPRDPDASRSEIPNYREFLKTGLEGVRLGVPRKYFYEDNDPEVERIIEQSLKTLEKLGAKLVDVQLGKEFELFSLVGIKIFIAECVNLVEDYLKNVDPAATIEKYLPEFGPDVSGILGSQKGTPGAKPVPAYEYLKAIRTDKAKVLRSFQEALIGNHALVAPTTPVPATMIGEEREIELRGRKVPLFATFARYTSPVSLVGLPAISIPAGWTTGGLPVGIQFIGRHWDEARIIQMAYAYQEATKWYRAPRL